MCYIQMSLMGCPGVVIIGDTLVGNIEDMVVMVYAVPLYIWSGYPISA